MPRSFSTNPSEYLPLAYLRSLPLESSIGTSRNSALPWMLAAFMWIMLRGAFAAEPIPTWLDDPYFTPNANGTESGYYGYWHLYNQMPQEPEVNAGYDANLLGAWNQGFTGAGVIIAIVDDGVLGNHPDLIANFRNEFSWDFTRGTEQIDEPFRGLPRETSDNHGTAVAGIAAARGGNGKGGLGAAPFLAWRRIASILGKMPAGGTFRKPTRSSTKEEMIR